MRSRGLFDFHALEHIGMLSPLYLNIRHCLNSEITIFIKFAVKFLLFETRFSYFYSSGQAVFVALVRQTCKVNVQQKGKEQSWLSNSWTGVKTAKNG